MRTWLPYKNDCSADGFSQTWTNGRSASIAVAGGMRPMAAAAADTALHGGQATDSRVLLDGIYGGVAVHLPCRHLVLRVLCDVVEAGHVQLELLGL